VAKPPVSYAAGVKLAPPPAEPVKEAPQKPARPAEIDAPPQRLEPSVEVSVARRRPMESRSDPTVVYMHPDGKYELKRYALARGPKVKVHDLIMEALEEWAERHGIAAPFRVPSERPRRSS
jgi:hypothetical protein